MLKKTLALLVPGLFLLCLFSFFSVFPQNPAEINSVHLFAFHCMLKTTEYELGYIYSSAEAAAEYCHYNLRLSLLVAGYGGAGTFLTAHSLKAARKMAPKTFKKTSALLLTGIFLLCLLSVFSSLAELKGDPNTAHLVTYHCMLETVEYPLTDSNMWEAAEECYFNPGLSALVFACGISGSCLIAYSLGRIRRAAGSLAGTGP